jgi:hypothetical protein
LTGKRRNRNSLLCGVRKHDVEDIGSREPRRLLNKNTSYRLLLLLEVTLKIFINRQMQTWHDAGMRVHIMLRETVFFLKDVGNNIFQYTVFQKSNGKFQMCLDN